MNYVPDNLAEEGDIAVVTTLSGHRYVGIYTLAPGIDYYWKPAIGDSKTNNSLTDPDIYWSTIGKAIK